MHSVSPAWTSKTAITLIALCGGCSAASQAPDNSLGGATPRATVAAPASAAAGVSGAASGRSAVATVGVAGAISKASGGASGSTPTASSTQGSSTAGTAKAGSGGQAAPAGSVATSGSAGAAGTAIAMSGAAGAAGSSTAAVGCKVVPIADDMRSRYKDMDNKYYTKYADANGIIVATGSKVADEALSKYCLLMVELGTNEKVRQAVIADKMWFTMIDQDEELSSLPQIQRDYGSSLNARARGLGGLTPTICAEDSIMCLPGDKWDGDCICPHETGHTIYSSGIAKVPELSSRLTEITKAARSSGRLSNAYVWMDGDESGMMAWGIQVWYNCAINGTNGGYHSDINTRAELQKEMPEFHQFLSELMPAEGQYKDCYAK